MDEETYSKDFYWPNVFFKVEDKLFCVPRCEFEQSSEVFADMFLLPSGPAVNSEGQDKEHPIVLQGYKKDEFACLLKVMYPTARSLISGTKLDLCLKKEEWVSVLKLSTIWNMKEIREYAIHRLSTDVVLPPIEKIQLARANKVARWLDEGVTGLVGGDHRLTLEELATLGWETAALILWIRENSNLSVNGSRTLRFGKETIKCAFCSSSESLMNGSHNCYSCRRALPSDEEFTYSGNSSPSGTADRLVALNAIACSTCGGKAFYSSAVHCHSCSRTTGSSHHVRITPSTKMIKEVFGEEIKDLAMSVA
ncbi:hypothetical protein BDZ97DRAFT_1916695 [Flammula alnicola]|nr:hypothetical protein BDZ97DRAFT_1916695 [Flammula alnicola]